MKLSVFCLIDYEEAANDFEIYGLFETEWIDFNPDTDFEAFLIKRLHK